MAKLPRRSARDLSLWLVVAGLFAPATAQAGVDLIGTWHVLVHYTDDNTSAPDRPRWNDRVWVFARKGSRLEWTEYPIVVFADDTGRFERRSTGQYARVLGAWEPSEAQLRNIEGGLKINTRGSKKKSLRGSDAGGWRTVSRSRPASASIITYQENWSIEGMPQLPVFTQEDVMGSARSEALEGVTRYETAAVGAGGNVLTGRYERDGTRHGTFRMRRAGEVGMLDEKSQSEIQRQGVIRGAQSSRVLREQVRERVERAVEREGIQLSEEQIERLVTESIRLFAEGAERGQAEQEMRRLIRERYTGGESPPRAD
jgi:hypothetical protein